MMHLWLSGISAHFNWDDERDTALMNLIAVFERVLEDTGAIKSDFAVIVARPKPNVGLARVPDIDLGRRRSPWQRSPVQAARIQDLVRRHSEHSRLQGSSPVGAIAGIAATGHTR